MKIINFTPVFKLLIRIFYITSIALMMCVPVAIIYNEPVSPFIISSAISLISGYICHYFTRKTELVNFRKKEAYLTVSFSWLIISILGALPYLFSGSIPSVINAFFESVSGFTTTGSSILTDIEVLPKSILFWRSLTHWIGGLGIIVLVIIIMPTLKIGSYNLFTLESSLHDRIQPRIKEIGKRLLIIYLSLTFIEAILLCIGGMNLFESICHSFGTIATGGFSPKNSSIGGYSPYIQYIVMIFMILAGTNFTMHYYALKRKFNKIKENEELKFYLVVILFSGIIITAILFFRTNKSLELSFREAFFQVVSIITCTGFATTDYLLWPVYAWILIFFLMFLGGCTGSTAGGIKMARHLIFLKNIQKIFRQLSTMNAIIPLKLNKNIINEETNNSVLSFILMYVLIFVFSSIILVLIGLDGKSAAGSVITTMGGIGPGIGSVGPAGNFAHLPHAAKLILSFLMIFGRLEIYTIIVLFTPGFWKN